MTSSAGAASQALGPRLLGLARARPLAATLWVAVLPLLLIVVRNAMEGVPARVGAAVVGLLITLDYAWATSVDRPPKVSPPMFVVAATVLLGVAMVERGVLGALWCYPVLMAAHLMFERGIAWAFSAAVLVLSGAILSLQFDGMTAARVAISLAVVLAFVYFGQRIVQRQRKALNEERERLDLLVRCTRAGTLEWDAASNRTQYSPRLLGMLGYPADTDTRAWNYFDLVDDGDRDYVRGRFVAQIRARYAPQSVARLDAHDYRMIRADGGRIHVHAEALLIADAQGKVQTYLCSFMDITPLRETEAQLRGALDALARESAELLSRQRQLEQYQQQLESLNHHLASLSQTDALTGLLNRRALDLALDEACRRCLAQGEPLSVLMIDVDHFKHYNDQFGHAEGDRALIRVTQALQSQLGRRDALARFGGEEFALVMPGADDAAARERAEALRAAVDGTEGLLRRITISVGAATCTPAVDAAEPAARLAAAGLFEAADQALYRAKALGRNRVVHCADLTKS